MSKLISNLTKKQEAKIQPTLEKWRAIGLNTQPMDLQKAVDCLLALAAYKKMPNKPVKIYQAKSDEYVAACKKGASAFKDNLSIIVYDSPFAILAESKEKNMLQVIQSAGLDFSQKDAYWMSFYSFLGRELALNCDKELLTMTENIIINCGLFYTAAQGFLLADRPCEMHWNGQQELHNPNGMALKWKDGTGIYCLDGMNMKGYEWFFETDRASINPLKILAINNVDIRTRLMKVLGMEKFLMQLGFKVLNENVEKGYKLISVKIGPNETGLYLHMINPSTGEIHVEGVEDTCKTIEDAMRSRTPKRMLDKYGFNMPLAST